MQIVTNLHIPFHVKSIQNYRRQMKAETQQTKITFYLTAITMLVVPHFTPNSTSCVFEWMAATDKPF